MPSLIHELSTVKFAIYMKKPKDLRQQRHSVFKALFSKELVDLEETFFMDCFHNAWTQFSSVSAKNNADIVFCTNLQHINSAVI